MKKKASELLRESAGPFDASCMQVLAMKADIERLKLLLLRSFKKTKPEQTAENAYRRCDTCSSPRKGEQCWKCGAATFAPAAGWAEPELPPVGLIRKLAKEAGYAIGEHGSKERDLDLIAAPWVSDCDNAVDLMVHIADGVGGKLIGGVEKKSHGRLGCNIQMDGWYKLIDLSVLPKTEREGRE